MGSSAKKVMLAEVWDEDEVDPAGWWISEKLDGVRAYWSGRTLYTRQGNAIAAPKWFTQALPDDQPLDGELWCGRGQFQACVSVVRTKSKDNDEEWKTVNYLVFDAPNIKGGYSKRFAFLKERFPSDGSQRHVSVVGIKKCLGKQHVNKVLRKVERLGGEGLILRKDDAEYIFGRTSALLKVKTFKDEEAKVISYEYKEGSTTVIRHIRCLLPNGIDFSIGNGFSDADRKNPPKIGSIISFRFPELTKVGKPRFPTFMRARPELTWNDVLENAKTKNLFSQTGKPRQELTKAHSSSRLLFSAGRSNPLNASTSSSSSASTSGSSASSTSKTTTQNSITSTNGLPVCMYGANCYRKSKEHRERFYHPSTEEPNVEDESGPAAQTKEPEEIGKAKTATTTPPAVFTAPAAKGSNTVPSTAISAMSSVTVTLDDREAEFDLDSTQHMTSLECQLSDDEDSEAEKLQEYEEELSLKAKEASEEDDGTQEMEAAGNTKGKAEEGNATQEMNSFECKLDSSHELSPGVAAADNNTEEQEDWSIELELQKMKNASPAKQGKEKEKGKAKEAWLEWKQDDEEEEEEEEQTQRKASPSLGASTWNPWAGVIGGKEGLFMSPIRKNKRKIGEEEDDNEEEAAAMPTISSKATQVVDEWQPEPKKSRTVAVTGSSASPASSASTAGTASTDKAAAAAKARQLPGWMQDADDNTTQPKALAAQKTSAAAPNKTTTHLKVATALTQHMSNPKNNKSYSGIETASDDKTDEDKKKPVCRYGANCYRRNPQHLQDFYHPQRD